MLLFLCGRGFVSKEDSSENTSYYIFIEEWFKLFSPMSFNSTPNCRMLRIAPSGYINGSGIIDVGGVHIHELC